MKIFSLVLSILLFIQIAASSQSCLPEGITFTSQTQIDYFQTVYPGCTQIEGDVTISETNITNLNGLSVLTSIGGDLSIQFNFDLASLAGLENLTTISGNLLIKTNFALPVLTGLDGLGSVGGDLTISGDSQGTQVLTSLTGLESLTTVSGTLTIEYNPLLTSMAGLDNVAFIGGNLKIRNNIALTSLSELDHVTFIGGSLLIQGNALTSLVGLEGLNLIAADLHIIYDPTLTSLTGLDNITFVGRRLNIYGCTALESLNGLNNLTSVGAEVEIQNNTALTSLIGLDYLTSIGGFISIQGNTALTSLTGMDNLTSFIGDMYIANNPALISLSGFNSLDSINGFLGISFNSALTSLEGFEGITSVTGGIGIEYNESLINLMGLEGLTSVGGLIINTNNALNSFTGLSALTTIEGNVEINNSPALTNLSGLEGLNSIGGSLTLRNNSALTSLTGLENLTSFGGGLYLEVNNNLNTMAALGNLTSIGGDLKINSTYALTNLNGLNNVNYIGGNIDLEFNNALVSLAGLDNVDSIGGLYISSHINLTSLAGLNNLIDINGNVEIHDNLILPAFTTLNSLNSIGGDLKIYNIPMITSLAGLDNINAGSIGNLSIHDNINLATCAVQSVCFYLAAPGGSVEVYDNAAGCNSPEEIESICGTIYPLSLSVYTDVETVCIYDTVQLYSEVTGNIGNCSFLWTSEPAGFNSVQQNPIAIPDQSTLYRLQVNYGYQTAEDSIWIYTYPLDLSVSAHEDSVCINEAVYLYANLSCDSVDYIYYWTSQPPGFYSALPNPVAYPEQATIYKLLVTAGNQSAEDSVRIYTYPLDLSVSADEDSICANYGVNLNSTLSCDSVDYIYSWTSQPPGFYSTLQNPVAFPEQSTLYILSVTSAYQTAEDSIWVFTYPPPTQFSLLNGGFICDGSSGLELGLDGSELNNVYELFRNDNSTGITVPGTGFPISFGFQNIEGNYTVDATNEVTGCQGLMANTADIYYFNYNSTDQICLVNVDSSSMKNMIMWDKTPDDAIASYNIYRESTTGGSFEMMGNVSHSLMSVYLDNNSNPLQRSFSYGITTLDTCNNESVMSAVHTTMHLNINTGINSYNLIWTPYYGFDYQTYYIYRRLAPEGFQIIDSVPNSISSYTDLNPPPGILDYVIEIRNETSCNPQKDNTSYMSVFSNIISTNVGIEDLEKRSGFISVYPNPTREVLNIEIGGISGAFEADIYIQAINGQILISKHISTAKMSIDIKDLEPGVYIVQIKQGNTVITRRMVVI